MLKKLLCLIAIIAVLGAFDAKAMDSVDHSSTERSEAKEEQESFKERLIQQQIKIILKNKKSHKSLKSEKRLDSPKLSKL